MDDLFQLLNRSRDLAGGSLSRGRVQPGRRYLGVVYSGGTLPTSANRFHLTHPVTFSGTESEGSTGTLTADTSVSVPVLVLDGMAPVGTYLIADLVDGRWVSDIGAGVSSSNGVMIGCACATPPATLYMTVTGSVCANGLLNDCTITYRTTPSELGPLHLGTSAYLSTDMFPDPQTGDMFYYYLGCFSSIIRISRVFPYSIYGSPFLDSVVYFWTIGLPGNTCSPFLLSNGQIFFGGDPSCTVTISG